MGSKADWVEDLVKRCAAVGWEVTYAAGGHRRIKTHKGKVFQLASSPGDVHSRKNAERAAARHGLEVLEEKMTLQREKERLERLAKDRANGVDWEEEEKKIEEHKERTKHGFAVGGVVIVEVAQAYGGHPRNPNQMLPIKHGEELLLENESVIYRCSHPVTLNDKEQPCGRQFEATGSLRSHIAWHARQKPEPTSEQETIDILSDSATMAAITEAEAEVDTKIESIEHKITNLKEGESIVVKADVKIIETQRGIVAELVYLGQHAEALYDEVGRIGDELDVIREGVGRLRDDIKKSVERVATENVDVDELRAKAARYDEIIKITR